LHRVKACGVSFAAQYLGLEFGQPVDFCAYMAQYQVSLKALFLRPVADLPVR
jgi:hypothetical protein